MIFKTKESKECYFLSQPHQPFFILGVINAIIFMLAFMLAYRGAIDIEIALEIFHSYSLIFLVFTNFFIGFLFTTFPRFTQSETISKLFYTNLFYANIMGSILFLVASLISREFTVIAMIVLFISQLFVVLKLQFIFQEGHSINKKDPLWILVAQYMSLVGIALFIGAVFDFNSNDLAVSFSFYLYLIFLTFSVAQKMIPFFSHSMEKKDDKFVGIIFFSFIFKVTCLIFETHFIIKIFEALLDAVIGFYMLREFLRWKIIKPKTPAILWVLHLGLFWLPIAFFISCFTLLIELSLGINFYFLALHVVALGFLTTLFVGFATRVVLGHVGETPRADGFTRNIFLFIQSILLARVFFSINVGFGWGMNFLFDIIVISWLILFLLWGGKYGKILIFGNRKIQNIYAKEIKS